MGPLHRILRAMPSTAMAAMAIPLIPAPPGPSGTGGNRGHRRRPDDQPVLRSQLHHEQYDACAVEESLQGSFPIPTPSVPAPTQPAGKVLESVTPVATVAQGYTPNSDPTYGYIYGTWVASGIDSCPNTAAQQHYLTYSSTYPYNGGNIYGNCLEFTPGYYPNGIDTTSLAGYANDVVIFMPGVYYLNGNLNVGSATTLRNAWVGTQPSTQGVMFYFLSGGPLFAGGSGAASGSITSVPSYYMNCSSTLTPTGTPDFPYRECAHIPVRCGGNLHRRTQLRYLLRYRKTRTAFLLRSCEHL